MKKINLLVKLGGFVFLVVLFLVVVRCGGELFY